MSIKNWWEIKTGGAEKTEKVGKNILLFKFTSKLYQIGVLNFIFWGNKKVC